jgi:hypothetical protein
MFLFICIWWLLQHLKIDVSFHAQLCNMLTILQEFTLLWLIGNLPFINTILSASLIKEDETIQHMILANGQYPLLYLITWASLIISHSLMLSRFFQLLHDLYCK